VPIVIVSNKVFNPTPNPIPIPADVLVAAGDAHIDISARAQVAVVTVQAFNNSIGQVEPTAATTGYRGLFADLTPYAGSSSLAPGTYEGVRFDVAIDTTGNGYTFRDCLFRGPNAAPSGGRGLLRCDNASSDNVVIEYCTFTPQVTSNLWDGVQGKRYSATRCDVSDVVDGFRIRNTQTPTGALHVHLVENYIHDQTWFPDSGQSDGQTHNDGVQMEGGDGSDVVIQANSFWGRRYSTRSSVSPAPPDRGTGTEDNGRYSGGAFKAIQYTNLSGYTTDVSIVDNWFHGYNMAINAGSAANTDVGRWWRNKSDDAQNTRVGGSLTAGQGIVYRVRSTTTLDGGEGTANKNVYMAGVPGVTAGAEVTIFHNG
jgi:hypothetical protein